LIKKTFRPARRQCDSTVHNREGLIPKIYLALTVTVRFGPTVGRKLLQPSGNTTTSWGDRQVDRIKLAADFTSRGAPWCPGSLAPWLPGARRGRGSREWLRSRAHSGGPSSLSPQPNRAPKAAMDSSSYGAHADMLGARIGVRAAEDGHLTLLRAHAAVVHVGCCCCHPPNACKCHRGLQGPCFKRGTCFD
jgi:hypothetical protein